MDKNKNLSSGISMGEIFSYLKDLNISETYTPGVLSRNGNEFAGLFELDYKKYKNPVLVTSTDGVGTKIKIAIAAKRHSGIGIDLVAMSVNDILTYMAKPLFLLDYFSTSQFNLNIFNEVLSSIIKISKKLNMVCIGGETAKMPGFYRKGLYDLCATVVGIVEKDEILDGKKIQRGNTILGIPSSGFHSNGYSVIQEILFKKYRFKLTDKIKECDNRILKDILLEPTRIYTEIIYSLNAKFKINGLANITGGGILDNSKRILPKSLDIELFEYSWPSIFRWFQSISKFSDEKMQSIFNCGIGMTLFVNADEVNEIIRFAEEKFKLNLIEIGKVI